MNNTKFVLLPLSFLLHFAMFALKLLMEMIMTSGEEEVGKKMCVVKIEKFVQQIRVNIDSENFKCKIHLKVL
jgi:hypothetical protein